MSHHLQQPEQQKNRVDLEAGLDFLLTHFSEPVFPRKISTALTEGGQFEVRSRAEVLEATQKADYLDCRINAYPPYTGYKGINRQAPNLLFIDIDRGIFASDHEHRQALQTSLQNIKTELGGHPTVIWSGNGWHTIQPLDMPVLEEIVEFSQFEQPSVKFLRYAEQKLSNGKADPSHKPSFKSCMLRIPGSLNQKCTRAGKDARVKIAFRWNGKQVRPSKQFMTDFYIYLADEHIKEIERQKKAEEYRKKHGYGSAPSKIAWIETLLQTPIVDYRKNALALIIAPYLINIRQLSYEQANELIQQWLAKCNEVQKLDAYFNGRVKAALETTMQQHSKPMKLDTLKSRNSELYDILTKKVNHNADSKGGNSIHA
jgi:hypothetical protein